MCAKIVDFLARQSEESKLMVRFNANHIIGHFGDSSTAENNIYQNQS